MKSCSEIIINLIKHTFIVIATKYIIGGVMPHRIVVTSMYIIAYQQVEC